MHLSVIGISKSSCCWFNSVPTVSVKTYKRQGNSTKISTDSCRAELNQERPVLETSLLFNSTEIPTIQSPQKILPPSQFNNLHKQAKLLLRCHKYKTLLQEQFFAQWLLSHGYLATVTSPLQSEMTDTVCLTKLHFLKFFFNCSSHIWQIVLVSVTQCPVIETWSLSVVFMKLYQNII